MNVAERVAGALSNSGTLGITSPVQKDPTVGVSVATPFAGVFETIASQSRDLGKQASNAVTGLLSGQGVEVHDVVIASQKASAAFELALQVRNKAVSAYQQMMGMQF